MFLVLIASIVPACGSSHNSKPRPTIPNAPTSLTATPASTTRIDLTWIDNSSNEAQFRIERSDDGGKTYTQIAAVPADTTAYSDLGLLSNWTYFYRVAAWNGAGLSPYAGPTSATTKSLVWKSTIGGPGVRADHTAIYDSLGKRMILFGGQDGFNTPYNDVWALNLTPTTAAMTTPPVNYWTQLSPSGASPPSPRFGHSAIYDTQNNRMIVFGGFDATGYLNDVYILTLGGSPAWSPASPGGTAPSKRMGHTAVYDAANQQMVIFGGNDAGAPGVPAEKGDTFFLSLPANPAQFAWFSGPLGPVQRTEHVAVYDGPRQQMVVFGGLDHDKFNDGSDLNQETWALNLTGSPLWTQLFPSTPPSLREGHAAIYDAANQQMVLFGGDTSFSPVPTANFDLWSLRLDVSSAWRFLSPNSGSVPAARYGHTAVYDSGAQRMIIYGGYDNSGFPTYPTGPTPPVGVVVDPYTWIIDL
jgi:hypothetical protein